MGTATFDFSDETVIVTGSTKGIGRAIASGFVEAGANVVINARTPADVEETQESLAEHSKGEVIGVPADMGEETDIERLLDETIETFGGVDHLVNNAAAWPNADALDGNLDDYDLGIAVNARGPYYASVIASESMRERDVEGSIVNVTSVKGHQQANSDSLYGMSKAAQNGVTWRLAYALAEYDIRVNAISTDISEGAVRRNQAENLGLALDDPAVTDQIDQIATESLNIPLQRAGRARDMADGALFLASDRASYITGHILRINGGRSLL